jgi:hypothetical protein
MTTKTLLRKSLVIVAALLLLISLLIIYKLSSASIEVDANGIHKRLLVPINSKGESIGIRMGGGTGDGAKLPGFLDGPIVRPAGEGSWTATWFCEDRVHEQRGNTPDLTITCAGKTAVFPVGQQAPKYAETMPMPGKVAVLSDVEGNQAFFDGSLTKLGVMDRDGKWTYGDGHLVIVGDAVDRGRDVFGVLWRLYSLSIQAKRHGGGVHLVQGNHEQYVLHANPKSVDSHHWYAVDQMGGMKQAFAADTVIGRWLREQPVLIRMGKVLFLHGGIGKQVTESGMSIEQLNAAMRSYWRGEKLGKPELEAVLGMEGVTQYRGYLDDEKGRAPLPEVTAGLERFGASTAVVGHTLVYKVQTLYDGRVFAIDVNTNEAADETLVFENGEPRVVPVVDRGLLPETQGGLRRPFQLTDASDLRALGHAVWEAIKFSRVPYPY